MSQDSLRKVQRELSTFNTSSILSSQFGQQHLRKSANSLISRLLGWTMEQAHIVKKKRPDLKDLSALDMHLSRGIARKIGKQSKKLLKRGVSTTSLLTYMLSTINHSREFKRITQQLEILIHAEVSGSGVNLELAKLRMLELIMVIHSTLSPRINGGTDTVVN